MRREAGPYRAKRRRERVLDLCVRGLRPVIGLCLLLARASDWILGPPLDARNISDREDDHG